jgi:sortase A
VHRGAESAAGATRERGRPGGGPRDGRDRPPSDRNDARLAGAAGGGAARTGAAGSPADEPARGDRARTAIRGVAQLFITLGLVLLLFAVYQVWFTGVLAGRAQDQLKSELDRRWETGDDPVIAAQQPARPGATVRSIPLGEGFALIYVPDFGPDYVFTILEGTGTAELDRGPGHYPDSALPGEVGNFAVAGHRVGKGSPFLNLDKLKVGSAIVIRTKTYWYTYRVLGDPGSRNPRTVGPLGIPGMQVVDPSEVGVIAPVPDRAGVRPTQRLLTLTTCHPKFSARERLVIHAQLEGSPQPASSGLPPALSGGG